MNNSKIRIAGDNYSEISGLDVGLYERRMKNIRTGYPRALQDIRECVIHGYDLNDLDSKIAGINPANIQAILNDKGVNKNEYVPIQKVVNDFYEELVNLPNNRPYSAVILPPRELLKNIPKIKRLDLALYLNIHMRRLFETCLNYCLGDEDTNNKISAELAEFMPDQEASLSYDQIIKAFRGTYNK